MCTAADQRILVRAKEINSVQNEQGKIFVSLFTYFDQFEDESSQFPVQFQTTNELLQMDLNSSSSDSKYTSETSSSTDNSTSDDDWEEEAEDMLREERMLLHGKSFFNGSNLNAAAVVGALVDVQQSQEDSTRKLAQVWEAMEANLTTLLNSNHQILNHLNTGNGRAQQSAGKKSRGKAKIPSGCSVSAYKNANF